MNALVITVAGVSSRFSESVGEVTLKCIYHENDARETLLRRILLMAEGRFDRIVIVGGFKLEDLCEYLEAWTPGSLKDKITVVDNQHFSDWGSGWSLYLGLEELRDSSLDSVVFVEGDLCFDEGTFEAICDTPGDVLTCTDHVVDASLSVAFYCDMEMHPHYIYDVLHGAMCIREPFTRIYNSGQVWRFADCARLFEAVDALPENSHRGTNLEIINEYYSSMSLDDVAVIRFGTWFNCNRIEDYRAAFKEMIR